MQQAQNQPNAFGLFSLRSLEEVMQMYAWFEQMRMQQPVFRDEQFPVWQLFRYADVQEVTTDYSRFSSAEIPGFSNSFLGDTLVTKDPPDHRKLRNLVNQAFTPRAVARLSERVTQITQELLDAVRAQGKMDLVSDIAFPLPAKVIAELLGVPATDWDIFKRWAVGGGLQYGELSTYFSHLLQERRKQPREDLISALSNAQVDGERLNERELINFCILLLSTGQETTKNLIANTTLCFTDHPDSLQHLLKQPELMPNAIEEVLRYLPPVWFLFRRTTTDVELAGQHIPANQVVMSWLASAHRDKAQFPDADTFNIAREPNRHLGFGHGIHFCVGAPLARLEARIALPMILDQLQDLQRVKSVPLIIQTGIVFIITKLPMTFRSA